jgi:hypothetical protein
MRSPCCLCVYVSPLIFSFCMPPVSYQRKLGDQFFQNFLLIKCIRYIMNPVPCYEVFFLFYKISTWYFVLWWLYWTDTNHNDVLPGKFHSKLPIVNSSYSFGHLTRCIRIDGCDIIALWKERTRTRCIAVCICSEVSCAIMLTLVPCTEQDIVSAQFCLPTWSSVHVAKRRWLVMGGVFVSSRRPVMKSLFQ